MGNSACKHISNAAAPPSHVNGYCLHCKMSCHCSGRGKKQVFDNIPSGMRTQEKKVLRKVLTLPDQHVDVRKKSAGSAQSNSAKLKSTKLNDQEVKSIKYKPYVKQLQETRKNNNNNVSGAKVAASSNNTAVRPISRLLPPSRNQFVGKRGEVTKVLTNYSAKLLTGQQQDVLLKKLSSVNLLNSKIGKDRVNKELSKDAGKCVNIVKNVPKLQLKSTPVETNRKLQLKSTLVDTTKKKEPKSLSDGNILGKNVELPRKLLDIESYRNKRPASRKNVITAPQKEIAKIEENREAEEKSEKESNEKTGIDTRSIKEDFNKIRSALEEKLFLQQKLKNDNGINQNTIVNKQLQTKKLLQPIADRSSACKLNADGITKTSPKLNPNSSLPEKTITPISCNKVKSTQDDIHKTSNNDSENNKNDNTYKSSDSYKSEGSKSNKYHKNCDLPVQSRTRISGAAAVYSQINKEVKVTSASQEKICEDRVKNDECCTLNTVDGNKPKSETETAETNQGKGDRRSNKGNVKKARSKNKLKCEEEGKGERQRSHCRQDCCKVYESRPSFAYKSTTSMSTIMSYRKVKRIFQNIISGKNSTKARKRYQRYYRYSEMEELGLGRLVDAEWYPHKRLTHTICCNLCIPTDVATAAAAAAPL